MPTTSAIIDQTAEAGQPEGKVINFYERKGDAFFIGSGSTVSYTDSTSLAVQLPFEDEEIKETNAPSRSWSSEKKKSSSFSQKVIRTHYAKNLIENFEWLIEHHEKETPLCIPYISSILNLITEFADKNFDDPFSSFLLALYDGLANEDYYLIIDREGYKRICSYIKVLNNKELDYKEVDKYIFKLEEIGLNITPY